MFEQQNLQFVFQWWDLVKQDPELQMNLVNLNLMEKLHTTFCI